ncbi:MAG: CHAT domain-containing protein [Proteobacteria bacterium]|nr:MAG: CHAT domain-containing protein [Pseudomonadota bacterium]
MRKTFLFLLSVSLASYGQDIHLKEENAKIYQVSKDSLIHIGSHSNDYLIIVENQDLDTFGSITLENKTIHSASWMGPYGNYLIHIPGDTGDVKIQVQPLESSVESTSVKLTLWSLQNKSATFIKAIQDQTRANDLRIKQYLGHSNQTIKAIEYFTDAAEGFAQDQAMFFLALSLFEKGTALMETGAHTEGLDDLKKAGEYWSVNHTKQHLRASNFLGLAFWKTGQLTKALAAFEKIIHAYTDDLNSLVLAQAINNAGLINLELGEFTQAKKLFYRSLALNGAVINLDQASSQAMVAAINNSDDVKNTAATLNNLALVYDALGEPERAEAIWLAYIEVSKNISNQTTLAKAKNNLAMHYLRKGHYEQAQQLLETAKNVFVKNTSHRWLSLTEHNLAVLFDELGLLDLAEIHYKKALHIRDAINHPKGHMESLYQLASTYRKQGKLKLSLDLNKKLLVFAEQSDNARFKALSHLNQYHIFKQQDDVMQAVQHIDKAILYIKDSPFKRTSSRIHITKAEQLIAAEKYPQAIQILQNEVNILKNIWSTRLLNSANNLLARAHYLMGDYQTAQQVIKEELTNIHFYLNNTSNSKIATNLSVLLKETLNINALILDKLGQSEAGLLQTMQHTKKFKAYQEVIKSGYAASAKNTAGWLQKIKNKADALESLKLSKLEREQLQDEIIELKAKIDFSYNSSKVTVSGYLSLQDIQQKLDANTLLIVYSIGHTDGLSWWISHDKFITQKLPGKQSLKNIITAARNELIGHSNSYQHSKELSKILSHSLSAFDHITKIKLLLDEPLNLVSFSSLNDVRFNYVKPIAQSSAVQRVLNIDALQKNGQILNVNANALIVADPVYSVGDNRLSEKPLNTAGLMTYPRLKNSQIETELISAKLKANTMTGFMANKESFLAVDYAPYKLLHIATHAFFHPDIPGLSALVLSTYSENGLQQKSAYVRALDIGQLTNDLDLTVLSGCETGIGDSDDALGLTGLTQSFLLAGSNNVVSSLWQVDDQASTQFMAYFYAHLVNNMAIDQAFWLAQKSMLKNPRTRHPKYWAGWFLITK